MKKIILTVTIVMLITMGVGWGKSTDTLSGLQQGTTDQVQMEEYASHVLIKGKWGKGPGEFGYGDALGAEGSSIYPKEFTIDDDGNIYIADRYNNRVQKFDQKGKFVEMYPVEIFVLPTDKPPASGEVQESVKTWNKNAMYFEKVSASGLAWLNGQLYIFQKKMPNVTVNRYVTKVLVLKSGKFVEATNAERKIYEEDGVRDVYFPTTSGFKRFKPDDSKALGGWIKYENDTKSRDVIDKKGNRFVPKEGKWEKYSKNGKKIFEFPADRIHKFGRQTRRSMAVIHFDRNNDIIYEMEKIYIDEKDWHPATIGAIPNPIGIQITKWTLKR